jgi:hypothetical protein
MEGRAVADGSLDSYRLLRGPTRIDVGLLRPQQHLGSIGVRAKNRLASDDNELAFPDYLGRRGDDVIEMLAAHR